MSGRMEWTDTEDVDVFPGRATDAFAAALDRLDPYWALAGKKDEDQDLPPDGDLDEDDEFDEDDEDALDDDVDAEDDDELDDDELIDLDDEYDDTDVDDRPHPGHRYDE